MKGSHNTRWRIALALLVVIAGAVGIWHFSSNSNTSDSGAAKPAGAPAGGGRHGGRFGATLAPVQAATATSEAVPRYLSGLGTITAANTVTVRSRVDGQLMAIHFQEGQQVKAGDLLAEIDPSQFKVALAQAQGQLAKDKATLANARRDLARYQQLVKTNLVLARNSTPSSRWSAKPKAPLKPMRRRSPARSSSSTGAGLPRLSMAAWV